MYILPNFFTINTVLKYIQLLRFSIHHPTNLHSGCASFTSAPRHSQFELQIQDTAESTLSDENKQKQNQNSLQTSLQNKREKTGRSAIKQCHNSSTSCCQSAKQTHLLSYLFWFWVIHKVDIKQGFTKHTGQKQKQAMSCKIGGPRCFHILLVISMIGRGFLKYIQANGPFLFFFSVPISQGFTISFFVWEIFVYWTVSNLAIEEVTFHLCGWSMLSVFL